MKFALVLIVMAAIGVIAYFITRHIRQSQKISKIYQMNLHDVPLARALLYACVPEKNLFLDVNYLQRNTQSGLYFTIPISAAAVTRGGIVIFHYFPVSGKLLNTDGEKWAIRNNTNLLSYVQNPFSILETQAKVLLSMLKQNNLVSVPVHAYAVILNEGAQILQPREDIILPRDIPKIIYKYDNSRILSTALTQKTASVLSQFRYTPVKTAQ